MDVHSRDAAKHCSCMRPGFFGAARESKAGHKTAELKPSVQLQCIWTRHWSMRDRLYHMRQAGSQVMLRHMSKIPYE